MTAGIVLAGGLSLRMGRDKAGLDWHGVPLLAHVCAVVRRATGGPVVVVGAPGRPLPLLPPWVMTTVDAETGVGPMQGLLDGLRALGDTAEAVFLAGTDAPLLRPALVEAVLAELAHGAAADAAIPFVRGHRHPLLAAYRTSVRPLLEAGIAAGGRRAGQILHGRLRLVSEVELLAHAAVVRQDPGLRSVDDADTPDRLAAARAVPPPQVRVERRGAAYERAAFRLADLAGLEAVPAASLRLEGVADADPLTPLADGDVVRVVAPDD